MPSLLAISAQERTLPSRKCAVHEWTLRITDQGYDAVPVNRRFCGISLFAFLVEFFPVSKDIETRRILSRIPPWAAISKQMALRFRSQVTPANSRLSIQIHG